LNIELPACRIKTPDANPIMADAFGPIREPEVVEAWRDCERRRLPTASIYADLTREAQQIADRLAHAN
jgi:hypothetical protein